MTITLSTDLPAYPTFTEGIRRAPDRGYRLTPAQTETALRNALRYIPVELHEQLAPELMDELLTRGKIYGYRFRFRRKSPVRKDRGRYQMKGCCLSLLETLFLRYSFLYIRQWALLSSL